MREKLAAYREQLSYLFFGVLTTLVNYGMFWALNRLWQGRLVLLANLLTFLAATAFAFLTNKAFVFRSRDWRPSLLLRQAGAFAAARLFAFGLEEAGLYLAAYILRLDRFWVGPVDGVMAAKVLLSILAVVLNYFFSKFWVFSKKNKGE